MATYELALLLKESEKADQDRLIKMVQDLIEKSDGKNLKTNHLGRRQLAYPIKKSEEGIYVIFNFDAQGNIAQELEKKLKLEEAVLRHLILRKD